MILKIKINVKSKVEAYRAVSNLGFEYEVMEADLDGVKETFGSKRKPSHFMKETPSKNSKYKSQADFKNN